MSANNIGSLVKSLFQVNIFSPFPSVPSVYYLSVVACLINLQFLLYHLVALQSFSLLNSEESGIASEQRVFSLLNSFINLSCAQPL